MTSPGPAKRLLNALTARWRAPDAADGGAPALDPRLVAHAAKVCDPATALAGVRSGDHVFLGTACATPRTLVRTLESLSPAPSDLELLHFLTDGALVPDAQGQPRSRYRHRCFFVGQEMRRAVRAGEADYVPVSAARLPQLIAIGRVPVDVALIQVSMPDDWGYVSLGVSVDVVAAAVAQARLVIAEVNPQMPRTQGDSTLHVDALHHLVPVDTPVIEYLHPPTEGAAMEQIARYVASVIDDGSTLQIGPGRFPQAALALLADRHDLGLHTDLITDAILPLIERGVLTGRLKTHQPGKIVCSLAMGSRRLYDLIDGNPRFDFQPLDQVADPRRIAEQHKMVSVTQAFAVDLTGQVCADQDSGGFYGGQAAQAEFMQGASRSPGGKAIVCLSALEGDGRTSRIHATFADGQGATIARADVHYVITEFGIAYLFGRSIRERAMALIQVAHPDHRAALTEQAQALGYLPTGQSVRSRRAYDVAQEQRLALKDQRPVQLRPAQAVDGDRVRDLFHQLPAQDVYTRFFRKVKGLSLSDVQRLCNLNEDTEVALVAVTGDREDPRVVAHAMYVLDPGTNLAETAFIVHPDWQGAGLGGLLQQRLAALAQARGVRGFVADILASNERMVRLARAAGASASETTEDGVVRITTLFGPASA